MEVSTVFDSRAERPHVTVLYRSGRDVAEWSARNARGEVPGKWPYGLDEIADDSQASARNLDAPTPIARAVSRAVPAKVRARLAGRRDGEIGLTWDENVALGMVDGRPYPRMFSGVIWMTDNIASGDPKVLRRLRMALRSMDGVWVNSRAQIEPLRTFLGPDGPAVKFFRFGVDPDFFSAQPYPERPLLVSVGGDRDRDPRTLFAALERVRALRPELDIVVQSSADISPPAGVTKIPHVSHVELRQLYARASVIAVATRPNLHVSGLTVSLESMATGRPVVITDTPGMDDYIRDGDNGYLTPTGDPVALAEAIERLLADPSAAAAVGARGRDRLVARMTSRHLAQNLARFTGVAQT
jgi:Glycosyl transferases group 1